MSVEFVCFLRWFTTRHFTFLQESVPEKERSSFDHTENLAWTQSPKSLQSGELSFNSRLAR